MRGQKGGGVGSQKSEVRRFLLGEDYGIGRESTKDGGAKYEGRRGKGRGCKKFVE